MFREVSVPVSPTSKKCQALDMAQKLKQEKRKHQDPLDQVNVETDNESNSGRSAIHIEDSMLGSP